MDFTVRHPSALSRRKKEEHGFGHGSRINYLAKQTGIPTLYRLG
ncbi:MAG: hypothetical protein ACRC62_25520 [Microcoleus sp.]